MRTDLTGLLKKNKKRNILVVSAGGQHGGIQCLYLTTINDHWEIIAHSYTPYSSKIADHLNRFHSTNLTNGSLSSVAWLDYKLSCLYVECARSTLAQVPKGQQKPHLIVLNESSLWKGVTGEQQQQTEWNIRLGDAQLVASSLGTPVLSDLIRHDILAGGQGLLPLQYGNQRIASAIKGTVILINIGLVARITIIDTVKGETLVDSDTGPGTCCINHFVQQHAGDDNEGFDRDGTFAAKGNVDGELLNKLTNDAWFLKPAPKQAQPSQFAGLLGDPGFSALSTENQLATATALSARTIYDFFRREFTSPITPETVLLSGGGSNNLTLQHYLKTYFDTIPVESIETLGVPIDMRIPLALGLSVNACAGGTAIPWSTGDNPRMKPVGRLVWP
jgi:anhydro-N-acetylmuramic acid kinase